MSSISLSLVVVFFCVSSHLCKCNARSFGVVPHNDISRIIDEHLITEENDEKSNPSRVSTKLEKNSSILPNATKSAEEENINESEKFINGETLDESRKHIQATKKSNIAKGESLSYVSWRVPHTKRGEQETEFNLDYLPPKTHPPVHN